MLEAANRSLMIYSVVFLAAIAFGIFGFVVVRRRVSRPINRVTARCAV